MKKPLLLASLTVLGCMISYRPATGQSTLARQPTPAQKPSALAERALLDQYCVTCHDDEQKTSGLSLQKLDLATVGDHPELWEKVVRKLRAGMMPPPGMARPALEKYEEMRDWLEGQIDRTAAVHPNPGSVVLHRQQPHRIRQC